MNKYDRLRAFFKADYTSGLILLLSALAAIVFVNTGNEALYNHILETRIGLGQASLTLHYWINDGLMTIFFFFVAMEIKREILIGELSTRSKLILPVFMALGGMMMPALIFIGINWGNPHNLAGWAIPAATDIAFSLGVLALLGSRVPLYVKVLLTAVAIIDDMGAILIIALFYSDALNLMAVGLALIPIVALLILNLRGVKHVGWYVALGLLVWFAFLHSGVHATIAGVLIAALIPMDVQKDDHCLLRRLEHKLKPWVAYGIMPLFALANSGVSFDGVTWNDMMLPMPVGIILGLCIGKPLGIFGFMYLAKKTGIAKLPYGARYLEVVALAFLCGIGFTMSLFIGSLAFDTPLELAEMKLGVLGGSTISAILGSLTMVIATRGQRDRITPDRKLKPRYKQKSS